MASTLPITSATPSPTSVPSRRPGQLFFALTIEEVPADTVEFLLHIDGTDDSGFCGPFINRCVASATPITIGIAGHKPDETVVYRFERNKLDGTTEVFASGSRLVGDGWQVEAIYPPPS